MNSSIRHNKEFSFKILDDFDKLSQRMQGVADESSTISDASRQQTSDLDEIMKLTENIVAVAEETATSSNQVADSTTGLSSGMKQYKIKNQELLDIARDLNTKTMKFILERLNS